MKPKNSVPYEDFKKWLESNNVLDNTLRNNRRHDNSLLIAYPQRHIDGK